MILPTILNEIPKKTPVFPSQISYTTMHLPCGHKSHWVECLDQGGWMTGLLSLSLNSLGWQGCWSSSCFCSRRMITKIGEDQMTWPAPKVHFDHWASPVYLWKILSITNNFTSLKKIFWLSLLQNANYCHIKRAQQNLEFLGEFHGGAKSTWIWRNSLGLG